MIVKKNVTIIDLTKVKNPAFHLLFKAHTLSKKGRWDFNTIFQKMTKSTFSNLVKVFDKHFGEECIIYGLDIVEPDCEVLGLKKL